MEVRRGDVPAAFLWFREVPAIGRRVLEAHGAVAPSSRGRWLTRRVLDQLLSIVDHARIDVMIAQVRTPLVARIWSALGFTIHGSIALKEFP